MAIQRTAAVAAGAALIVFGAAAMLDRAPTIAVPAPTLGANGRNGSALRSVGVSACASSGCHGGSAVASLTGTLDDRTWAGSAAHWLALDPHTKAYAALESTLAKSIMERFAPGAAATEDVRCIACHTNPSLAGVEATSRERLMRSEGVSCEACHGDAGKWMPLHTTWTPSERSAGYESSGMAKLFDIGERAVMCAGCHVGAPADEARGYPVRDMNHDMIAAGHPRLNFDFADHQRRLPPHWKEDDGAPEFEVKAWLVGRAAHAEVAAKLTADRETRGKAGAAPWPEFADYSCVSCHHKLGDGFPSVSAKPAPQVIWPRITEGKTVEELRVGRIEMAHQPPGILSAFLNVKIGKLDVLSLDVDVAGQVFHGLAARERMRMKREGRATYDPAFDRLASLLKQRRGNLDFKPKPDALTELASLLKK